MVGHINWWLSDGGKKRPAKKSHAEPKQNPNASVQSTPVVQPFVVVPYSTPMQPIYHYNDGTIPIGDIDSNYVRAHGMPDQMMQMNPMMQQNPMMQPNPMMPQNPMMAGQMGGMDDLYYNMDEESQKITKKNTGKKRKGGGVGAVPLIVMLLLALFATLTLFIGSIVSLLGMDMSSAFAVSGSEEATLFSSFGTTIGIFTGETALTGEFVISQLLLTISTVLFGIVFLSALVSITRKKLSTFVRVVALIAVSLIVVALILCLVTESIELGLAAYALTGIAVLTFLISLIGKKNRSRKKNRGRRK